jgi:GT2 family glycosyltransferase
MITAALVVLNYNGIKHLEILLPSLIDASKNWTASRIIILDNQSTEGDVEWMRLHYPEIDVVIAPRNDFLLSYNWLAKRITEELLVVLNNDLAVEKDFLRWMVPHFENEDVFAVTGRQNEWNSDKLFMGLSRLRRHRPWYQFDFIKICEIPTFTLFASGGFSAIDRIKFNSLGGYDSLFHPGYCEDVDLSFRAWGRGWKSVYEPRAVTRHRESSTFGPRARRLNYERQFLFHWRNLRQQPFFSLHLAYMAWLWCRSCAAGNKDWIDAFNTARELWRHRKIQAIHNAPNAAALKNVLTYCGQPLDVKIP